jgi:hypothetical protein
MLEMPQMVQTWKEVCFSLPIHIRLHQTNYFTERSWSWMEEVAEEIEGLRGDGLVGTRCTSIIRSVKCILWAFGSYYCRCTLSLRKCLAARNMKLPYQTEVYLLECTAVLRAILYELVDILRPCSCHAENLKLVDSP